MDIYHHPVSIHFGSGALAALPGLLADAQPCAGTILLLTRGGTFSASPEGLALQDSLQGYTVHELPFEGSNPDLLDLVALQQQAGDFNLVIAVGGGSVMDMGKALAGFRGIDLGNAAAVRQGIAEKAYVSNPDRCSWIGIPTTSGTGSEVTPWGAVWDRELGLKYSVDAPCLFAHAAIVDPVFTQHLPLGPTISTALDALCHATESYWAKPSHALTRPFSLAAIEKISRYLPDLVTAPDNLCLREHVAMGSLLAGMAFSQTRTTACHSISYPMTLQFGIDHGIAVCLTLGAVMRLNEPALVESKKLYAAFGADSAAGAEATLSGLLRAVGVSPHLRDYGITKKDIPEIASRAFTKGRMDNNPVELERAMVEEVLYASL